MNTEAAKSRVRRTVPKRIRCEIQQGSEDNTRVCIDPLAHQFDATDYTTRKFFTLAVWIGCHKLILDREFATKTQATNAAVHVCDTLEAYPEFI